ncbi:cytochrome C oxidase subunit IV family protein [Planctomicrobium sp. SH668]|uniref:cytochrome C oxidase subunit IV family protein n=1 Tax=Planctomicrobium sp. SH668 TaxID=3448126 RepID=UPI003F5C7A36
MVHISGQEPHESHPNVKYFSIFLALCLCTAFSVALDLIHLSPILLVVLVLAVAVAKAIFVMTYFMHLKFEGKWKFLILAPTAILAVGLVIALAPDIAMEYYTDDSPQARAHRAKAGVVEAPADGVSPAP